MPFEKNHKLSTGRKKGSINKSTIADREILATILEELKQIRAILNDAEIAVYVEVEKPIEQPQPEIEKPVVKAKPVEVIPEKKTEATRPRFIPVAEQIRLANLERLKNKI